MVYIDELESGFCKLWADTDVELEEFRRRLGLPHTWKVSTYYALRSKTRQRAIEAGAVVAVWEDRKRVA